MYLQILKKDLKRKKAMNVILLVFIILASMFVSSGVNNIISVTTALDDYFEMADAPDYLAVTMNKTGAVDIDGILNSAASVESFSMEKILYMASNNITFEDESKTTSSINPILLQSDEDISMNYILDGGGILQSVKSGEFYMTAGAAEDMGLAIGDKMTVKLGGVSCVFTFAGGVKDAVLGSTGISIQRYIISAGDFEKFISAENVEQCYGGELVYIRASDMEKMISEVKPIIDSAFFSGDKAMLKLTYVFDMMVVGTLLVVSLVLVAVALVLLRFTITFTLSDEFREIGVMKAIGIHNLKIRGLYLVKYTALSVIGVVVGLALSFPFGEMLVSVVPSSIIINNQNAAFSNVICAVCMVGVIMLFCYGCTSKVGKMSPIDAVRNGQTGERFRKKSMMSLGRSRLPETVFLALNDIVSSPKRFGIITFAFFLCLSLLLVLSTTVFTLKSGTFFNVFGLADFDISAKGEVTEFMTEDGHEKLEEYLSDMEENLAQNGMPARCMLEMMLKLPVSHDENESSITIYQGTGTTADMYEYIEGTPPQSAGEAALTRLSADKLKADIGDTITIKTIDGDKKFMITALFQSMNNMGEGVRVHEDEKINYIQAQSALFTQIKFTDDPDEAETARRMEKIQKLYPELDEIKSRGETISDLLKVVDTFDTVKQMVVVLTFILAALITVLMERSFIVKEQGEIAFMKAVGTRNGKIYAYHTLRFVFVGCMTVIAAELFALPLTHLFIDPIFKMMGMALAVDYVISPFEMFLVFPLVILAATAASAFFTSLYTKTITALDTANIE
ncbi:MAG: FtsX-like permease family protein [Lachnospiraceae bacterium]|nr:FtsX-like permease family protein [Lachnospiraceae bacterium]